MRGHELALRILLRWMGTASLLALVAVFLPVSWMESIHRNSGLGELPQGALVEYLARSLSAFYAMYGGLLWLVSFNLEKHRGVIRYQAWAALLFGIVILAVDIRLHGTYENLPLAWVLLEGPFAILYGLVTLFLLRRTLPQ
jgi:hypothetical protein